MEYKKKQDKAIISPTEYCSPLTDRRDKFAFGIPNFTTCTKEVCGHSLKVKPICALEHSKPNRLKLSMITEDHEMGPIHIVEALHRFWMEYPPRLPLPHVFFLELNNCFTEIKKYLISYHEALNAWVMFEIFEGRVCQASLLMRTWTRCSVRRQTDCNQTMLQPSQSFTGSYSVPSMTELLSNIWIVWLTALVFAMPRMALSMSTNFHDIDTSIYCRCEQPRSE